MLTLRAERANVAWRLVHQAVANHLVFALEALAMLRAIALLHRTVVWPVLRMDVCV